MYKVPFVNYPLQYRNIKDEINTAINDVLSQGDLILRKDVEEFEENIASFVGTKYAVGLNSGTDALYLSLRAVGIGSADEVITVSHTFFATISSIVQCGATPVLVDIRKDFNMDMDKIEESITPKTKAVIPVHFNGRVCDMERLMSMAKKHSLIVIEDAAQALGAEFNGKRAGSFGLTGCFSFYPAKVLGGFGDGGLVTTNDRDTAEKIRILRNHGQKNKTEIIYYGINSRLDNLQAVVLNVKFKYLPKWIERRREIANLYYEGLANIRDIGLPPKSDERFFDVYQNYVLRAEKRDELFNFLKENGVEALIKDPIPNHWQKNLSLSHFQLPYTEKFAKEVISLPIYPELTDEQIGHVVNCVRNFYQK